MSKNDTIRSILSNPTYQQDSGVMIRLRKALNKISRRDLSNLNLILNLKFDAVIAQTKKNWRGT